MFGVSLIAKNDQLCHILDVETSGFGLSVYNSLSMPNFIQIGDLHNENHFLKLIASTSTWSITAVKLPEGCPRPYPKKRRPSATT